MSTGTSFFITERMMAKEPSQALPITAAQCAVSAALAGAWALSDGVGASIGGVSLAGPESGWLLDPSTAARYALPGLLLDTSLPAPDLQLMGYALPSFVALAALWTGLVTTAANRIAETVALGQLSSAEASVSHHYFISTT